MKAALTAAQRSAAHALLRAYDRGEKAALLQLPTGQGKSEVAVRVFRRLRERRSLKLIVVTPGLRPLSRGWRNALELDVPLVEGEPVPIFGSRVPNFFRVTHQQLSNFVRSGTRPSIDWQRWIVDREAFVVFDEFHRGKRLKRWLAGTLPGAPHAEDWVPSWLRIRRGRPSRGPLWLMVSATPYNPVELDFQLDARPSAVGDDESVDTLDEKERAVVVDEVQTTLAFIARLGDRRDAFPGITAYAEGLRARLAAVDRGDAVEIEAPSLRRFVTIVPQDPEPLKPHRHPRPRIQDSVRDERAFRADIHLLHAVYRELVDGRLPRALAERLLLAGVRAREGRLEGQPYGHTTVRAVRAAQHVVPRVPTKLEALTRVAVELVRADEKLLVFCTHRAVAVRVARQMRSISVLRDAGVRVATSGQHLAEFDEARDIAEQFCSSDGPMVLVATDAFSESVDLHDRCRHLAHYELPWSPLRVLQRFGRLWRLHGGETRVPAAMHFIHPGSVEEEILHRLRRRWAYLEELGLGYLGCEQALGVRLPKP